MKRGTLLAVAVASALGSSASFAQTYLCSMASDMSVTACEKASDSRAFVSEPSIAAYQAVGPRPPDVTFIVPKPDLTVTTYTYSGSWPETEPSISSHHYSYGPYYYYY